LLGFGFFLAAQIINMVSMAMTPQAVLSCLGSWTMVCNAVFARILLKENLSRIQVVAVVGLIFSTIAVICFAPRPSLDEERLGETASFLGSRFVSSEFELLTAILLCFVCMTRMLAYGLCGWERGSRAQIDDDPMAKASAGAKSMSPQTIVFPRPRSPSAEAAAAAAIAAKKAKEIAWESMDPFSWATAAAVAAGYTALLFKCVAELLARVGTVVTGGRPRDDNPLACWQTYVIAGAAFSCAPAELHFLNLSLQAGEAVFVVPVYLALGMVAQLLTGVVFFQEFRDFSSVWHFAAFCTSVVLILIFVVQMTKAQASQARTEAEATRHTSNCLLTPLVEEMLDLEEEPVSPRSEISPEGVSSRPSSTPRQKLGSTDGGVFPTRPYAMGSPALGNARHVPKVKVAGFSAAIESLDSHRGRHHGRSSSRLRAESAPF